MSKELKVRLNNTLYNAGIVGFIKVLKTMEDNFLDVDYTIQGNTLIFSSDVFNNFTEYYLKTLIDKYEKDTIFSDIMNEYEILMSQDSKQDKQIKKVVRKLKTASNTSRYKKAFEYIVNKKGDKKDIEGIIKFLENTTDLNAKLSSLEDVIKYMQKHKDIFLVKDIAETKVKLFWSGTGFCSNKHTNKHPKDAYEADFINPVLKYLNKNPKKISHQCIECRGVVPSIRDGKMSWINDMGVDVDKKKSNFWNFEPDVLICPICRVIYSCIPLGFYMIGKEGLFVNSNITIDSLLEMNNHDIKMESLVKAENAFYFKIARALNYLTNIDPARKQISTNVKVIKRVSHKKGISYQSNILTPFVLTVLSEREKEFKRLLDKYYTFRKGLTKTKINIYDKVIENILKNRDFYQLMYSIIRDSIKEDTKIDFLWDMLKIQVSFSKKGVVGMERKVQIDKLEKTAYHIRKRGIELRNTLCPKKGYQLWSEGKIKTCIYKLLDALRINNLSLFMQIATRMFNDAEKEIPLSFVSMLTDEDLFEIFGYAFVMGLLGQDNSQNEIREGIEIDGQE